MGAQHQALHATALSWQGRGILVLGAAGCGKSDLALQLMAFGAGLIADDAVLLTAENDSLWASAPPTLPPLIEARGMGLLNADLTGPAPLVLAVDLDQTEADRLPPLRHFTALGCRIPLIHRPMMGNLAAAIIQFTRAGRREP